MRLLVLLIMGCLSCQLGGCNIYQKAQEKPQVPLVHEKDLPHQMEGYKLKASFTTPLTSQEKLRLSNINLALIKLRGKVLVRGEELSFKQVMQQFRPGSGFQLSKSLTQNQPNYVPDGPEQVATTLYLAANRAGMAFPEVHLARRHQAWAPREGEVLLTMNKDVRIKNNLGYPVKIWASLAANGVTVAIYGDEKAR